jgi:hypothetical protein
VFVYLINRTENLSESLLEASVTWSGCCRTA